MSSFEDDRLRSTWTKQVDQLVDVDFVNATALLRRQREIERRDRVTYVSAAIIAPSWVATIWLLPDLRPLSLTGLAVGIWVTWQIYRRSGARVSGTSFEQPCLVFQRALLERERDLAFSRPKWQLAPLAAAQVAIAATMATNSRFTNSSFFPEGLVLFVSTAGVVLVVAWRRSKREVIELQRELDALSPVREQ